MKSKYGINFVLDIFLVIICITSCKKFVQVPPPVTKLVTASVFNNNTTATAAMTNIYTEMFGIGATVEAFSGLSSDELTLYNYGNQTNLDLYTNSLNAKDGNQLSSFLWSRFYNYIYQSNAVIQGLHDYGGVTPSIKKQLTGEAEFVRALSYFYLVNFYGDVPLLTTTSYQENATASRTGKAEVYQQIISDLEDAGNLLSSNFLDATDTAVTTDRVRPTKWAASALLARVYLYTDSFANAAAQATLVINNSEMLRLDSDLNQIFLKNSSEAIWEIMPPPNSNYTAEGNSFILTASPTVGSNNRALSTQLLNAFEASDNRRIDWVDSLIASGTTYFYPYKYRAGATSTSQTEYEMVLRLAEQYLIRAEANAQLNDLLDAADDLNIIRSRAGLSNTTATTQSDLLTAIDHERQVELFAEEWGDRWLNMKRRSTVNAVMTVVTPQKGKGGFVWNTIQQLYPIPLTDINSDPNLKQSPGY